MKTTRITSIGLITMLALVGCGGSDKGDAGGDTGSSGTDAGDGYYGDGGGGDTGSGYGADYDSEYDEPEEEPEEEEPEETECDDETPVSLWISPDDSNSMSSPVMLRAAALDRWGYVGGVPVRTWEFLNYYDFDYPAADDDELAVYAAMAPGDEPNTWRLQVGVASPELAKRDRPPMNIALSIDSSGSMSGRPINLVKSVARDIAGNLREGDIVSLVTWDTSNRVILDRHEVDGPDDATLTSAIGRISAGGGTDLHGGLSKAYELAEANFDPSRTNRVVLLSDGGANAGVTDIDLISAHAGAEGSDGIYMVGVGVSDEGSYNDRLMDAVTDAGRGASVFIHKETESERVFDERFVNTMEVAARDVRINLELPPGFEIVRFSGEEYSSDPREVEPQNIAPNDSMVIHQTITTCDEALSLDAPVTVRVTWKDAVTWESGEATLETTLADLLEEDQDLLEKGAAIFAFTDFLKAQGPETRAAFVEALEAAEASNPGDDDLAEIRAIYEAI